MVARSACVRARADPEKLMLTSPRLNDDPGHQTTRGKSTKPPPRQTRRVRSECVCVRWCACCTQTGDEAEIIPSKQNSLYRLYEHERDGGEDEMDMGDGLGARDGP
jgi:hypothetical protein